jgi:hypothetical protein
MYVALPSQRLHNLDHTEPADTANLEERNLPVAGKSPNLRRVNGQHPGQLVGGNESLIKLRRGVGVTTTDITIVRPGLDESAVRKKPHRVPRA